MFAALSLQLYPRLTDLVLLQLTGHHPFGVADKYPHISSRRLGFECRRDTLQDQVLVQISQQHIEWVSHHNKEIGR